MSGSGATSPRLGAVALAAALATMAGLALGNALLVHPMTLGPGEATTAALVVASQALAWWWLRRRARGLAAAALRLIRAHAVLALWAGADLVVVVLLWARETAGASQVLAVWETFAVYLEARAALVALGVALGLAQRGGAGGQSAAARGGRLALLGAALAAPAVAPLTGPRPAWLNAVVVGLLALAALGVCGRDLAARDTWVGLAGLLGTPALALGGCTLLLGRAPLPLAAPLALSALAAALAVAALATPVALGAQPSRGPG